MNELDQFILKMENTLKTYQILLQDERERTETKGIAPVDIRYYEGCVHVLSSLLYLAADIKRTTHVALAEKIKLEKTK